jgi:hypothetical protein
LNQQLTRARKRAMSNRNTINIMDCINKGLVWINNDDWNQMIKEIWSTLEFQRRSKFARNNRLTETDGKLSTHARGTVSFASYRVSIVRIVYICYNGLQIFIFILSNIFCLLIARKSRWKRTSTR